MIMTVFYGNLNNQTSIYLGRGSLNQDIRWDDEMDVTEKQKMCAIIHHQITDAEKIFWHGIGNSYGTHEDEILRLLQTSLNGGPSKIQQLKEDWGKYVKGNSGWNEGLGISWKVGEWTSQALDVGLRSEFETGIDFEFGASRELSVLNAFLNAFDSMTADGVDQEERYQIEERQIQASISLIQAAVEGGGTHEDTIFSQLANLRGIYERRIARAGERSDEAHAEHLGYWDRTRRRVWNIVRSDIEEGTSDGRRAQRILFGDVETVSNPADENDFAIPAARETVEAFINAEMNQHTRNWGAIETRITDSFKRGVLRLDTFHEEVNAEGGSENFQQLLLRTADDLIKERIFALTSGSNRDHIRGRVRFLFELMRDTSDSALTGAIQFLTGMNSELKTRILNSVAQSPDVRIASENENPNARIAEFITHRFPESQKRYDLIDIIDPADSVLEKP